MALSVPARRSCAARLPALVGSGEIAVSAIDTFHDPDGPRTANATCWRSSPITRPSSPKGTFSLYLNHRRARAAQVRLRARVFAAQHYSSQLVLANSQRTDSRLPRSHHDKARRRLSGAPRRSCGPATRRSLARWTPRHAPTASTSTALDTPWAQAAGRGRGPAEHDVDAAAAVAEDELDEDLEHSDAGDVDELDQGLDGD